MLMPQGLRLGQFDCLLDVTAAVEATCSAGLQAFQDTPVNMIGAQQPSWWST